MTLSPCFCARRRGSKIWKENPMKGIVKKLCDIDGIAIPAEMLEVHVDDK